VCDAFVRHGSASRLPGADYSLYFFQSFARASAASLRARSFCECALSVRLRRGLPRSRRAPAVARERLPSLSTTARAASKIIRGSRWSGFDDELMRTLQARKGFPTIQAMWEGNAGQILIMLPSWLERFSKWCCSRDDLGNACSRSRVRGIELHHRHNNPDPCRASKEREMEKQQEEMS
jgi:hypothetical protein